jgi:hypothetical protein
MQVEEPGHDAGVGPFGSQRVGRLTPAGGGADDPRTWQRAGDGERVGFGGTGRE